ncbi:hypothetical protein HY497_01980 [Candidatus Woesearchaeota archaeon]|nr:hypothetical protein [Candidatus Woesearchaeota archaeon]
MKHFIKIKPGAVKFQKAAECQTCRSPVNKTKDYFMLEAYWSIKRKADKHMFCSLKCMKQWAQS